MLDTRDLIELNKKNKELIDKLYKDWKGLRIQIDYIRNLTISEES